MEMLSQEQYDKEIEDFFSKLNQWYANNSFKKISN
jgi:hypothetical protein